MSDEVTVTDVPISPSEQIKARASKIEMLTDALGRKIGVRHVGPLQRMTISRMVQAEDNANPTVSGHHALAYSVASIDGAQFPLATSANELEAMIERLDEEGIEAIMTHTAKAKGIGPDGKKIVKNS